MSAMTKIRATTVRIVPEDRSKDAAIGGGRFMRCKKAVCGGFVELRASLQPFLAGPGDHLLG
jgi:hypothetical protein